MGQFRSIIPVLVLLFLLVVPGAGAAEEDVLDTVEAAFRAHREGEYDQAVELYTQVIQSTELKAKERAVAFLLRGEVYKDKGDYQRAIADFTRAIKIRADYAQAFYFRGLTYEKLGSYPEALADVGVAVKLNPDKELYRNRLEIIRSKAGLGPPEGLGESPTGGESRDKGPVDKTTGAP
ncbi:MAG: tetratricopeptide repeat protein [Thermodesulfobacteriota bacterium]